MEMSKQEFAAQQAIIMELSKQESRSSACNNQEAEQAGITQLIRQKSGSLASRNHAAQQAIIMEMSTQKSRCSAGNKYGAEQSGITQLIMQ